MCSTGGRCPFGFLLYYTISTLLINLPLSLNITVADFADKVIISGIVVLDQKRTLPFLPINFLNKYKIGRFPSRPKQTFI